MATRIGLAVGRSRGLALLGRQIAHRLSRHRSPPTLFEPAADLEMAAANVSGNWHGLTNYPLCYVSCFSFVSSFIVRTMLRVKGGAEPDNAWYAVPRCVCRNCCSSYRDRRTEAGRPTCQHAIAMASVCSFERSRRKGRTHQIMLS